MVQDICYRNARRFFNFQPIDPSQAIA